MKEVLAKSEELSLDNEIDYAEISKERMDQLMAQTNILIQFSRDPHSEILHLSEDEAYQWLLNKIGLSPEEANDSPEVKKIRTACQSIAKKVQTLRKYSTEAQEDPKGFLERNMSIRSTLQGSVEIEIGPMGFFFEVDTDDMSNLELDGAIGGALRKSRNSELNGLIYIQDRFNGSMNVKRHEEMHLLHYSLEEIKKSHSIDEMIAINEKSEEEAIKLYEAWIEKEQLRAFFDMHTEFVAYATATPPSIFQRLDAFGVLMYAEFELKTIKSFIYKSKFSKATKALLCKKIEESFKAYKREFQAYQSIIYNLFRHSDLSQDQIVSLILITPPLQLKVVAVPYIDVNFQSHQYDDAERAFVDQASEWNAKNPEYQVPDSIEELEKDKNDQWETLENSVGNLTVQEYIELSASAVRRRAKKLFEKRLRHSSKRRYAQACPQ